MGKKQKQLTPFERFQGLSKAQKNAVIDHYIGYNMVDLLAIGDREDPQTHKLISEISDIVKTLWDTQYIDLDYILHAIHNCVIEAQSGVENAVGVEDILSLLQMDPDGFIETYTY